MELRIALRSALYLTAMGALTLAGCGESAEVKALRAAVRQREQQIAQLESSVQQARGESARLARLYDSVTRKPDIAAPKPEEVETTVRDSIGNQVALSGAFRDGVLTLDFNKVDDLLSLNRAANLRIVEVTAASERSVSSAHLAILLKWVQSGGIVWFHSNGYRSSLFDKVNPGVSVLWDYATKESGAPFHCLKDDCTGELFVRDLLRHIVIAKHKITDSVKTLYVKPNTARWYRSTALPEPGAEIQNFEMSEQVTKPERGKVYSLDYIKPTPGVKPIIYFVSTDDGLHLAGPGNEPKDLGETVSLLSLIERGRGLILLDATRIGARDWAGQDGSAYDGPRLYENIKKYGLKAVPTAGGI